MLVLPEGVKGKECRVKKETDQLSIWNLKLPDLWVTVEDKPISSRVIGTDEKPRSYIFKTELGSTPKKPEANLHSSTSSTSEML